MDFSGFAAIAALCKHINCQDQCGTVRFVSGVSLQCHTYPQSQALPVLTVSCSQQQRQPHRNAELAREVGCAECTENKHPSIILQVRQGAPGSLLLVYVLCPQCLTKCSITFGYFINLPSPPALCEFCLLCGGGAGCTFNEVPSDFCREPGTSCSRETEESKREISC